MNRVLTLLVLPVAMVCAAPVVGQASAPRVDASRPETVVEAMRAAGYKATLTKDKLGDPMVESAAAGARFAIFFYECKKNVDCGSIQFMASYAMKVKPKLERIAEWNSTRRFGKASLDKDGDPQIDYDLSTKGGVPQELFGDTVDAWADTMGRFQAFVGW